MSLKSPASKIRAAHWLACIAVALSTYRASAQEQLWITQFGTSANEYGDGLSPDAAGGVYLGGQTEGSFGVPNAGYYDCIVSRFDASGTRLWTAQFGTTRYEDVRDLAPDNAGGVYVVGQTKGSLGGASAGFHDVYIARYDDAGNQLWIRQFGSIGEDIGRAVAPDGSGGAFVAGYTDGSLVGTNAGWDDPFIAHYDEAGNQTWIRQYGTIERDACFGLAPDGAGGVFAAGYTEGNLGGANARVGFRDAYIVRFDRTGAQIWAKRFGGYHDDTAIALAADGSGGVFVGGNTRNSLGGPSAGYYDAFVARYTSAGQQLWVRQFGSSESDDVRGLASDSAGGVFVGAWTLGSVAGPNLGNTDALLAYYDGDGRQDWIRQFGTPTSDYVEALSSDGSDGVFVGGWTAGNLGGPIIGQRDAFVARYSNGTCYPDCDGNGVLDIFDFLCFQTGFVNSEPYACDCDPNPACDIFDFLCFQTAFVAGCP